MKKNHCFLLISYLECYARLVRKFPADSGPACLDRSNKERASVPRTRLPILEEDNISVEQYITFICRGGGSTSLCNCSATLMKQNQQRLQRGDSRKP